MASSFGISAGIVLEVGVDRHDEVAASFEEARLQRGGLPEVPAEMDDDDVRRCSSCRRARTDEAAVRRAVVDEDHLELLVEGLERGRDLVVERLERVLLVEQRDDDGDHVGEGIGRGGVGIRLVSTSVSS